MDKYEYKVRADEIKALIAEGEYAEAVKIADTIDWRRVKSVMMLCTISDLYKINRRYEDSRDILLLAYEKHPGGRLIVYSLCELSIKLEEYVQAIEYYKEFVQLAPKDTGRYILQYKLYEAQEVSLEERIAVLEEFKKKDYREKWAYELAYLYHRVGLETKCVEECDEMFLWFGDGRYVLKALELKLLHQPLTEEQQEKYEQMKQTGGIAAPEIVTEGQAIQEEAENAPVEEEDNEFSRSMNILTDPTQEMPSKEELDDIQVKTIDVSQYNTINLQKELAESMKEFLENNPTVDIPVDQVADAMDETKIFEPVAEEAAAGFAMAEAAGIAVAEEALAETAEELQEDAFLQDAEMQSEPEEQADQTTAAQEKPISEEVFFGNTAEVDIEDVVSELAEKNAEEGKTIVYQNVAMEQPVRMTDQLKEISLASPNPAISNTGIIRTFHKPSGYDSILSQEYDGQISLVVPEQEKIEKQITGQLSIDDIMSEWEKVKKENERKRMEEIKERVHKQTNALFADFDESTKTGLLEELEKAMVNAAMMEERKRIEEGRPRVIKVSDIEKMDEETAAAEMQNEAEAAAEAITEEVSELVEDSAQETAQEAEQALEEVVFADESEDEEAFEDPELTEEAAFEEGDSEDEAEQEDDFSEEIDSQEEFTDDEEVEEEVTGEDLEEEEADDEVSGEEAQDEAEEKQETSHKYQAREMSQAEREQFAPFIHHKKTRRQIVEAIDNISMASYTGNVVITGEEGTGTIALAKLLVKEIQMSDNNFSGKVAKISGTTLNKKDVAATLSKLEGGALIIEGATAMKKATVDAMVKKMNQEDKGLIILMEDSKQPMNEFLATHEALQTLFNLRVDVEALDDQTLVKYAKKYALEQEYAIDELGVLALHTRIADMQTSDHEVTLAEIEELVDEAIYYADRKTPDHFFDVLFGKRYDEEDMIILREKDFMHY